MEYYNPEMPLFTVLLEVDGGTYIAQLRSASVRGAITKYAAEVVKGIEVGTLSFRKRLSNELRDEAPVAIHGVRLSISGNRQAIILKRDCNPEPTP